MGGSRESIWFYRDGTTKALHRKSALQKALNANLRESFRGGNLLYVEVNWVKGYGLTG
jgi:hypothetical protein